MTSSPIETILKVCSELEKAQIWMVSGGADGSRESHLVYGRREFEVRDKFIEMMYFGPKEEAIEDEYIQSCLKDFDDVENYWHHGGNCFELSLEQAFVDIQLVDEKSKEITALTKALRLATDVLSEIEKTNDYKGFTPRAAVASRALTSIATALTSGGEG